MPEESHGDTDQVLTVLRDIWSARDETSAELVERFERTRGRACKNMAHVGFGGISSHLAGHEPAGDTNLPVDADQRSAWRERLGREGKLVPGAVSIGETIRRQSSHR
ncbi:MAG: hypothetical protein JO100_17170 [Pseudonocardia sp.]|jgi:hypothetical protein|nr:hypothetical protein [Pseudonocardia sp.]